MSPRQLIVLVVAAVAAIGALLVIRGMGSHRETASTQPTQQIAGQQVLVAAHDVPQGAALAPSDLGVALFPTASVSASFIRLDQQPSAQAQMVGAVTRRAFAQGEPITLNSVVQPDGHGFMAAQLAPGFRAVAIEVQKKTAAGGFIQPNDHVDVLVTSHATGEGGAQDVHSDIVLQDVRVLALGDATSPQTSGDHPTTSDAQVAVLELSAQDARTLTLAAGVGTLSLALRGVEAETVGMHVGNPNAGSLTQSTGAVKIHAFGTVTGGAR
jgi:pilus assembly protein CpaB